MTPGQCRPTQLPYTNFSTWVRVRRSPELGSPACWTHTDRSVAQAVRGGRVARPTGRTVPSRNSSRGAVSPRSPLTPDTAPRGLIQNPDRQTVALGPAHPVGGWRPCFVSRHVSASSHPSPVLPSIALSSARLGKAGLPPSPCCIVETSDLVQKLSVSRSPPFSDGDTRKAVPSRRCLD